MMAPFPGLWGGGHGRVAPLDPPVLESWVNIKLRYATSLMHKFC